MERRNHGKRGSLEYKTWANIKTRCYNKNKEKYPAYGGRGIIMCDAWKNSFIQFLNDVGPRPSEKHSLDRIDNNGNYEPGNVRWITNREQSNNRRNTVYITYKGVTKCRSVWAEQIGVSIFSLRTRIKNNGIEKTMMFYGI